MHYRAVAKQEAGSRKQECLTSIRIADGARGYVAMLDGRSGRVLRTVAAGGYPMPLVDDPAGRGVAVGDQDGTVRLLDAATGRVRWATRAGSGLGLAVDARTGAVVVADGPADRVNVLDARGGAVLLTIPVSPGAHPDIVAVDPRSGRIVVAGPGARTDAHGNANGPGVVSVLDEGDGAVLRTALVATQPAAVAVDPATGRAYVASIGYVDVSARVNLPGGLAVFATASGEPLRPVAAIRAAGAVAVDVPLGHAFVADSHNGNGTVTMLDAAGG